MIVKTVKADERRNLSQNLRMDLHPKYDRSMLAVAFLMIIVCPSSHTSSIFGLVNSA
jgi:hypothetical protein